MGAKWENIVPVISRFYGIVIRVYFSQREHNPPHLHAICGDDVAALEIATGKVLEGGLPPRALSPVREWMSLNREALLEIWNTQEFRRIPPLR